MNFIERSSGTIDANIIFVKRSIGLIGFKGMKQSCSIEENIMHNCKHCNSILLVIVHFDTDVDILSWDPHVSWIRISILPLDPEIIDPWSEFIVGSTWIRDPAPRFCRGIHLTHRSTAGIHPHV